MAIERNKYGRAIIRSEVNGDKGSAEVCWIKNDGYNVPHWGAFITVLFQDSKWFKYFSCKSEEEAIENAKRDLDYRLSRCGMI